MSGHNKWSKIKHKKGAKDAKRGNLFTKLAKAITLASKEGGGDPDMNFNLRLAVDKAKEANMPNDNIERAIKKGTGELEGGEITRVSYEAFGPSGTAFIIDCSTDNTNRTVAEIKKLVETFGGKVADEGSVSWQYEQKGSIVVKPAKLKKAEKYGAEDTYEPVDKEEIMMELMEFEGVLDIVESEYHDEDDNEHQVLEVYVEKNNFASTDKSIRNKGIQVLNSELVKVSKDEKPINEDIREKVEKFIEGLEEHEDVDDLWPNVAL